ncbi:MAG: biotin synthase BioB [Candidatus Omnitrophica bacterium]|nr:biotin synthase BioB [Candidatus Omnitrophota bacterium]
MSNSDSHLEWIENLKTRVLEGKEISYEEAFRLIQIEDSEELETLLHAAHEITHHFNSNQAGLCSLINAKSYLCGEDCGFCAQSVRYDTQADRYTLMEPEKVVEAAKRAEKLGTQNFCIVTSGASPTDTEFEKILEIVKLLTQETKLHIDASLGFITEEQASRLKEAGLRRFNHNLQSSREFYPNIVSTHTYDTRVETIRALLEGGLELCSGGILGMGETKEDRVRLAFELKPYAPHCIPINVLNPRPGTPLESQPKFDPKEVLKTIAVFRFIHPKSNIKLAGGREANLTSKEQERALQGGANGLIIGGYLTTSGNPVQEDLRMLEAAGFQVKSRR